MALKPEMRICSGRIHHIIAYLFCPVLSWLSLSRLAVCLAICPSALFGCLVSSVESCHVASTTQPAQTASHSISIDDQSNPYRPSINEPALTNVNDGSSDARRPATFAGTFGARSPSGLHGVWGALITNGSHHDLAIITGAPQQDPAKTTRCCF
ncbi:hypothetical protein CI102_9912 [Trichoderma harzianum]|uniref:Uncharacterized protein n=1 Tax=Trichoderma harzianum CBS 226.95 TaxID=983964 RepID=A0A2T4A3F1_TRIHA|nr:hypothetical protein M431DRAFT_497843 [Trichoderma harzianum CBS 226.95]PKK46587.1 hypothetical protein CI102_9912 [Trichoderma harzianum]PTB51568.1 hypothetical protein M431DRAFT_497843 [Trichoderma harzianum CBS 226.95]